MACICTTCVAMKLRVSQCKLTEGPPPLILPFEGSFLTAAGSVISGRLMNMGKDVHDQFYTLLCGKQLEKHLTAKVVKYLFLTVLQYSVQTSGDKHVPLSAGL